MTPHKRHVLVVALQLAVLLLAGCQLRADVVVTVDDSGGGTLAVTLDADDALRRSARQAGADPLAALVEAGRELPGWQVRQPDADGAVTLVTTFDDPAELDRISTEFADAVAAPELRPLEPVHVVVDDDTVQLRGGAGLDVTPAVRDIGLTPARARSAIADSVQLRVTASMPGEVLDTNAGERPDAQTVSWLIPAGQRRQLLVVSDRPWTITRIARLATTPAGAIALLTGAVLVAALVVRRRRSRAQSAAR